MQLDNAFIVAKREFLTRIKGKGFWITTIALPILMTAWMVIPTLMIAKTSSDQRLTVVDRTGLLGGPLAEELQRREGAGGRIARFELEFVDPAADPAAQRAELDRRVLEGETDAWLWIDEEGLAENRIEYHAESTSNFLTQEVLDGSLSRIVREHRLTSAGYDSEEIRELSRSVDLSTVQISATGSRADRGIAGFALAVGLFMILYMVLIIYGQQVMQGVLEEKSSRIVEVIVSAVSPLEMMTGKLVGVCALGLVQLSIWVGTALLFSAPGVVGMLAFLPDEAAIPRIPLLVVAHFFVLFFLGYFLYATFFAMIGSIFNNVQEAQQLSSVAIIFLVVPFVFVLPVINDPDSILAVVTSLIPVFTPLLMMLRIAVKMPPLWQILLAYMLTAGFTAFMIWLCARVYRVGILMYGKKPTFKEIWRWVRYA